MTQLEQLTKIAQMTYDHLTRDIFYNQAMYGRCGSRLESEICLLIESSGITLPPEGSSLKPSNPETPTPTVSSAPDQSPASP